VPPIRAKKARYFEDPRLTERVLAPPNTSSLDRDGRAATDDWSQLPAPPNSNVAEPASLSGARQSTANYGIRREPVLPKHENIAPEALKPPPELDFTEDEGDSYAMRARVLRMNVSSLARQTAIDPSDGLEL
jgi:type IV secretion system protein VirD4